MEVLKNVKTGYLLEVCVLILMATGAVFVYSAGANVKVDYNLQYFYKFTTLKQLIFFPVAVAVMYIVASIDYRRFSITRAGPIASISCWMLIISIILLILVLIPGIGVEKNFSRRWLNLPLGPATISFQPSELAKWSLILFLAAFLDASGDKIRLFKKRFLPICIIAGLVVALIIIEDFGTAAFIALLTFIMLFAARAKIWHLISPMILLAPAFYFAIVTSPTRINRIKAFLNPTGDLAANYQAKQSLIAISSGGIWGTGLGRGISKHGHLPEDTTDFIFAIIAEETGFFGAAFVILLFVAIALLGIRVISRSPDRFSKLLAAGILFTITIQALINLGVVTVLLPTKGIPLPFISAGGTTTLLTAAAAGLLINIARSADKAALEPLQNQKPQISERPNR